MFSLANIEEVCEAKRITRSGRSSRVRRMASRARIDLRRAVSTTDRMSGEQRQPPMRCGNRW